jgi:CO/xanthine dehydrogenase FAD-binding subunit
MKPPLFDYHSPSSVDEALALLSTVDGAMILAGGQSLIPAMNMRLANPSALIDIQRIPGLDAIRVDGGMIRVGAMVRHRSLELDDAAHRANPLIRETMAHVAHVPIRHRGTVVGSLCHADAAAEMPLLLVLTGGSVVARSPSGERVIPASDFFTFHMTTARQPDEMIVEARFGVLPQGAGHAFEEFTRRHGDYAIAAVGAILTKSSDGSVSDISLAACGISSTPKRLSASEAALKGRPLSTETLEKAARAAADAVTAEDDMHATAAYRKHLLGVLVKRAVQKAAQRAS